MNTNFEDADFTEYKLVRIKKKTNNHYNKKDNYKEKDKKTFNKNTHIDHFNKDQRKVEKYDFNQYNTKKYPYRNNNYYNYSYHNHRNNHITNKYTSLEEISLNQNKPIINLNNSENDTKMAIQTISETINGKSDLKKKLNMEKVHEWDYSKLQVKDKNNDSSDEPIFKIPEFNYSPYFFPNFPAFTNQFMYFMPPPMIFNPQQIHYDLPYEIKEVKKPQTDKFLNFDTKYLQELGRSLSDECKSLKNCPIIEEKLVSTPQSEEITVEIQKSEEFDSTNDNCSHSTNEETTSTIVEEKNINVTIQLEKTKKVIHILINENSDILAFSKKVCKDNNLKDHAIFSIYKKIKSSLDCYTEIKRKYQISKYKNLSNYILSDEYEKTNHKVC